MIPPFNEHGYLPPGIHPATLEEITERFGHEPELRQVQMESLRWLVELARRAGISRLIINGSFVTDADEPNDVDCALVVEPGYPRDPIAADELVRGLPFLDIDLIEPEGLDEFTQDLFAKDRYWTAKGMIEVVQWN